MFQLVIHFHLGIYPHSYWYPLEIFLAYCLQLLCYLQFLLFDLVHLQDQQLVSSAITGIVKAAPLSA